MVITFLMGDYEEMCDEYESVFDCEETVDVVSENDLLVVRTRRIVVPELHASFREAEWYSRNDQFDETSDDEEWEVQCSVWVQYHEHEKDPNKFISFASCGLCELAGEISTEDANYDKISQIECYLDTDELGYDA